MRLLVLVALPGLVFSWMTAAVASFFLPTCGESRLLSLFERPSECTLSPLDAALTGCSVVAVLIVALLVLRVVAPYVAISSPRRARR